MISEVHRLAHQALCTAHQDNTSYPRLEWEAMLYRVPNDRRADAVEAICERVFPYRLGKQLRIFDSPLQQTGTVRTGSSTSTESHYETTDDENTAAPSPVSIPEIPEASQVIRMLRQLIETPLRFEDRLSDSSFQALFFAEIDRFQALLQHVPPSLTRQIADYTILRLQQCRSFDSLSEIIVTCRSLDALLGEIDTRPSGVSRTG